MFSNFVLSFEGMFANMAWGLLSSVTSDPKNFMGLSSMDIIGTGSYVGLARLNTIFVVFPLLIDSERHLDAFRTNPIDVSFFSTSLTSS